MDQNQYDQINCLRLKQIKFDCTMIQRFQLDVIEHTTNFCIT